jgi:DNA mismatch repair protein MutS2
MLTTATPTNTLLYVLPLKQVGKNSKALTASLAAAAEVDLACARARLGSKLHGTIPEVGSEGVISLRQARHPVLCLRGKQPVPNDLSLDGEMLFL